VLVKYVVSLLTHVNVAQLYLFVGGFCNWFRLRVIGF
jgi:hypothetical protein